MDSSRITVHLPLNESPDAVLQKQQFGVPEEESVWTDFTILSDDETDQEEPSTPDHTTSASHIPNEFISSAAQGSQDFAADKSFNPDSYEIASLIPATYTGEPNSIPACMRNPDTDTSTVEIPISSYTFGLRHTASPAPLTSMRTGSDAGPYNDQGFDSAVPIAPDSTSAYSTLVTMPITYPTSVASKMYEHSAVELENYRQSCGGDLFSCKRGGLPFALKSEYQERLLWIMHQLDLNARPWTNGRYSALDIIIL